MREICKRRMEGRETLKGEWRERVREGQYTR